MNFFRIMLLSICLFTGVSGRAFEGEGTWDQLVVAREKMPWESLRGYRLFFHPAHEQSLRRSIMLEVGSDRPIVSAWALVRPLDQAEGEDAWLRVEGDSRPGYLIFSWDGTYRGREFEDALYHFEVHIRWKHEKEQKLDLIICKSESSPQIYKIAGRDIHRSAVIFKGGEFLPAEESMLLVKSEQPQVDLLARAWLPKLPEDFQADGVVVDWRMAEGPQGEKLARKEVWQCACQQNVAQDSPLREKRRAVRCRWDISDLPAGVYDVRVSLWHTQQLPAGADSCDQALLDSDRIRVRIED